MKSASCLILRIGKCMNIIGMGRQASLISSFDNVFHVFMVLFGNIKRCFILNCIIWEVIQNLTDKE